MAEVSQKLLVMAAAVILAFRPVLAVFHPKFLSVKTGVNAPALFTPAYQAGGASHRLRDRKLSCRLKI